MMPALRSLRLSLDTKFTGEQMEEMSDVTSDAFPCATECYFHHIFFLPSLFQQGAAPRLKHLRFCFRARWIAGDNFDLGMGHLPSLETVKADLFCKEDSDDDVKKASAALTAAAENHPNRPKLHIY
jgi:hypothetical protein